MGELRERDSEYFAKPEHSSQRGALYAAFEKTDVRAVHIAFEAELFLREASLQSQCAQSLTESLFGTCGRLKMLAPALHSQRSWCYVALYRATDYSPNLTLVMPV